MYWALHRNVIGHNIFKPSQVQQTPNNFGFVEKVWWFVMEMLEVYVSISTTSYKVYKCFFVIKICHSFDFLWEKEYFVVTSLFKILKTKNPPQFTYTNGRCSRFFTFLGWIQNCVTIIYGWMLFEKNHKIEKITHMHTHRTLWFKCQICYHKREEKHEANDFIPFAFSLFLIPISTNKTSMDECGSPPNHYINYLEYKGSLNT